MLPLLITLAAVKTPTTVHNRIVTRHFCAGLDKGDAVADCSHYFRAEVTLVRFLRIIRIIIFVARREEVP
jgi:hypothetical protein